ncbi:hypothetical protein KQX54_019776 [Cotesia glomerata]|uniref:Uncharacterized protein n=1 Tax=Cotesia glomerata TaxID=32391 RepID=A0AAV7HWX0_COTGL|nr:hypothetical protein KQX54_019776 [Cotesia glomerata]
MSQAEAGASWQHCAWDMTYQNHHPQQQLAHYQPQYQHLSTEGYSSHHHSQQHVQQQQQQQQQQQLQESSSRQGTSSQDPQVLAHHHHHHHHHHHNSQGQTQQYEDQAETNLRRQNVYDGPAGDPMITSSLKDLSYRQLILIAGDLKFEIVKSDMISHGEASMRVTFT